MTATPRRILAATDFSPTGERAQRAALALARRFDAELHVMHVQVLLDDPHLADAQRDEVDRLLATTDADKHLALQTAAEGHHDRVRTHIVRSLSAAEAITETCTDLSCDLIVVGTHGRRGLSHLLLGSVAEKVVRTAPVPVLTVRPDARLDETGLARLLVPHDFSEHSASAVRVAGEWARALGAAITLLHVVEPIVYPEFYSVDLLPAEMIDRFSERSGEALEAAAAALLPDIQVRTEIRVGRAGDAIVSAADPETYDLVIMGCRGLTVIEHLLLGSVAETVLRRCAVPILTVRT
jgi:nucleotide-binding universal stress UspA family protein